MSIIKNVIKYNGSDVNVKFSLSASDNLLGKQQQIDVLTSLTTFDVANPILDGEKFRYGITSQTGVLPTIRFDFFNYTTLTYQNTFIANGFNSNELNLTNSKVNNSFFIIDYYDSFDSLGQSKISTTYQTKIINIRNDFVQIIPIYTPTNTNIGQFYYIYIPQDYLDSIDDDLVIGYLKYSFYNAKTGNVTVFYNEANISLTTQEKFYFKIRINKITRKWEFLVSTYPNIIGREIRRDINTNFVDKVNNTVDKVDDKAIIYPTGTTFDYRDRTYSIT